MEKRWGLIDWKACPVCGYPAAGPRYQHQACEDKEAEREERALERAAEETPATNPLNLALEPLQLDEQEAREMDELLAHPSAFPTVPIEGIPRLSDEELEERRRRFRAELREMGVTQAPLKEPVASSEAIIAGQGMAEYFLRFHGGIHPFPINGSFDFQPPISECPTEEELTAKMAELGILMQVVEGPGPLVIKETHVADGPLLLKLGLNHIPNPYLTPPTKPYPVEGPGGAEGTRVWIHPFVPKGGSPRMMSRELEADAWEPDVKPTAEGADDGDPQE